MEAVHRSEVCGFANTHPTSARSSLCGEDSEVEDALPVIRLAGSDSLPETLAGECWCEFVYNPDSFIIQTGFPRKMKSSTGDGAYMRCVRYGAWPSGKQPSTETETETWRVGRSRPQDA